MKRSFFIIPLILIFSALIYIYLSPNWRNANNDIMLIDSTEGSEAWKKFSGVADVIDTGRHIKEADPLPTSSTYNFGNLKIYLTQKKPGKNIYYACDAWIKIIRDTNIVYEKSFLKMDLEMAGLYVPREQPLKDYFLIIKYGDYEAIQLIIDTTGTVREIPGGEYFITDDKKYMFVLQGGNGYVPFRVVDLSGMKIIFDSDKDKNMLDSRYLDFYKKNKDIYAYLIGDDESRLYKYNFKKHLLEGNIPQDTAGLKYINVSAFYENTKKCDCNNNRF